MKLEYHLSALNYDPLQSLKAEVILRIMGLNKDEEPRQPSVCPMNINIIQIEIK